MFLMEPQGGFSGDLFIILIAIFVGIVIYVIIERIAHRVKERVRNQQIILDLLRGIAEKMEANEKYFPISFPRNPTLYRSDKL